MEQMESDGLDESHDEVTPVDAGLEQRIFSIQTKKFDCFSRIIQC